MSRSMSGAKMRPLLVVPEGGNPGLFAVRWLNLGPRLRGDDVIKL
jgi:hypothetical protein